MSTFDQGQEEQRWEDLVGKVKTTTDAAKKVDCVNSMSETLSQTDELGPSATDAIALLIPTLLSHHSHLVYTSALTTLFPAFLPLVSSDKLKLVVQTCAPAIFDKVGDAKERIHRPAEDDLIALGKAVYSAFPSSSAGSVKGKERAQDDTPPVVFEKFLQSAMTAKASRLKIGAMRVFTEIKADTTGRGKAISLKSFLPTLVDYLEDADGSVREPAKETIVAVMRLPFIPLAARAELRRLCETKSIKTSVIEAIFQQLMASGLNRPSNNERPSPSRVVSGASMTSRTTSTSGHARTVTHETNSSLSSADSTPPIAGPEVSTDRELDNDFESMLAAFDGKETEHNWQAREKAIFRVRGMLKADVPHEFHQAFIHGLKSGFLANSVKALLSLRTTLAVATTCLYCELSYNLGSALDPFVDILLPHLGKLSGATKKIVAEASQKAVLSIIRYTSAPAKQLLPFINVGLLDKIAQSRHYTCVYLLSYLSEHAHRSRDAIEHCPNGGFAAMQDNLKKALSDSTPVVRETARLAFWAFESEWPELGARFISQLDESAVKQLQKAKPHGTASTSEQGSVGKYPLQISAPKARKPSGSIAEAIRKAKMDAKRERAHSEVAETEIAVDHTAPLGHPTDDVVRTEGLAVASPKRVVDEASPTSKRGQGTSRSPSPRPNGKTSQLHESSSTEHGPFEPEQSLSAAKASVMKPEIVAHESESPAVETNEAGGSTQILMGANTFQSSEAQSDSLYGTLQIAPDCSFWRQRTLDDQSAIYRIINALERSVELPQIGGSDPDNVKLLQSVNNWTRKDGLIASNDILRELYRKSCESFAASVTVSVSIKDAIVVLLWELAIKYRHIVAEDESPLIRFSFAVRSDPSASLRRGSSSLLSFVACTSQHPVLFLHDLFRCCEEARQQMATEQAKVLERIDVMTCVTIAILALRLPRSIWEEEAPRLRPLSERALASSSIVSREAATTLLMIILSIFDSSTTELQKHFPSLTAAQSNLVVYLLRKHEKEDTAVSAEHNDIAAQDRPSSRRLDPDLVGRASRRLHMNV